MTYFADLGSTTQIAEGRHIKAIGWLSSDHFFLTGDSPEHFVTRLEALCTAWIGTIECMNLPVCAGFHTCELCREFHASGNIAVPAQNSIYIAPQMISHYVTAHRYLPPAEFIAAVLAAPDPLSTSYAVALIRALPVDHNN